MPHSTDPRDASHYAYAELHLRSPIALPELAGCETTDDHRPDVVLEWASALPQAETDRIWTHRWEEDDQPWMLLAQGEGITTLRFPGNADFVIRSGGTIRIVPTPEAEMHTVRHQLLDQALPRYLAQQGKLVLHASAVRLRDGRAVLFLGTSGDGKSTLAGGFAAHCEGMVLADDCVVVDLPGGRATAIPSYPGLRLWNDSLHALYPERIAQSAPVAAYSSKRRLALDGGTESAKAPAIAAIFVLEQWSDTGEVWLERQPPEKACQGLMHNAFQMDIDDRQAALKLVAQAVEACRSVPVYALDYPRAYDWLPRAAERILALVAAGPERADEALVP